MRELRVLREAAEDAAEAAAYYESERKGLGFQFEAALSDALVLLEQETVPLTAISKTLSARGVGRLLLRRFPYSIVVRTSDSTVEVIAVAHHARRPGFWRGRLGT